MAFRRGDKEVVERLLSAGADVNHQNRVCDIYDCYDESCFFNIFLLFSDFDILVLFSFK